MTQYGTWASYSGSAKIMLALVPLSLSPQRPVYKSVYRLHVTDVTPADLRLSAIDEAGGEYLGWWHGQAGQRRQYVAGRTM